MDKGSLVAENKRFLAKDTLLGGKYKVVRTIGEGGFGITYEGIICENNTRIAIKEYFPHEFATRENAGSDMKLHILSGEKSRHFESGKKRFINEAEALKQFQYLQGIVSVIDKFEENDTAYIIMEYIEGITLKRYIEENGVLQFKEIFELLTPIMKSLTQIHRQRLIHRDISPDNILIDLNNEATLIDFGASKWLDDQDETTETIVLKNGYAPPEQYIKDGKQGPWTDVYGLAATMYMALMGHAPKSAIERLQSANANDCLQDIKIQGEWQKHVLITAMELSLSQRYKSMEDFYHDLLSEVNIADKNTVIHEEQDQKNIKKIRKLESEKKPSSKRIVFGISALFAVIILVIAISILMNKKDKEPTQNEIAISTEEQTKTEYPVYNGEYEVVYPDSENTEDKSNDNNITTEADTTKTVTEIKKETKQAESTNSNSNNQSTNKKDDSQFEVDDSPTDTFNIVD